MLSAEAFRLAAIEALCPKSALEAEKAAAGSGAFPTLARNRVFDSRATAIGDIDKTSDYTPTLALYTPQSTIEARGDFSRSNDRRASASLEVVAELAVLARDESQNVTYADAMAASDPQARLVLGALVAQVRHVIDSSSLVRKVAKHIVRIEEDTFAVPDIGIRWQRITMTINAEIRDDDFSAADGKLPEPCNSLYAALPAGSYAKAKLAALAAAFTLDSHGALEGIGLTTGPVTSGPDFIN